ncbi:multidrug effflux MFS transporter [Streptomyces canus]|uniref:multidrug effflux MFS transporter n=1 Tax=Streptomyces canus TaxID=58343 RepID=UPI0036967602
MAPLATDMYVPGFPELGRVLHARESAVQLSMTAFLAGLVLGQFVIGPLSDSLGRRRLLLPGTALFAVLSLVCALVPNVQALIAARFLQGVAGAAGMVLAQAVVTDLFHGPELPRYFSMLSMVLGVAPVTAPVLGGAILSVASWRAVFVVLAFIGMLLFLAALFRVRESLPPQRHHQGGVADTFRAMGRLLDHRAFVGCMLTLAFSSAALFSYIASSSFVFENLYGVSATRYSLIFATNAAGMLLAGWTFGALSRRMPVGGLLTAGAAVALVGTLLQVALIAADGGGLAGTWACLFVTLFGIGIVFPASMTLGQSLGRKASGAASALLGGVEFLLGALASPLVGVFGTGSPMPMAVIMLSAILCAALALVFLARPLRTHGALPRQRDATAS